MVQFSKTAKSNTVLISILCPWYWEGIGSKKIFMYYPLIGLFLASHQCISIWNTLKHFDKILHDRFQKILDSYHGSVILTDSTIYIHIYAAGKDNEAGFFSVYLIKRLHRTKLKIPSQITPPLNFMKNVKSDLPKGHIINFFQILIWALTVTTKMGVQSGH